MKTGVIIGLTVLALLWLSLCIYFLAGAGVTLYNLLICLISGTIVFVPLYKKYIKGPNERR